MKVEGRGQVSGHCTTQVLDFKCHPSGEYDRTVNNIAVKYFKPGNSTEFSLGQIFGKNPQTGMTPWYQQLLDSTNTSDSTGPLTYTPPNGLLFGEHKINAQMFVNTTPCNIQPGTSSKFTSSFFAVPCLPTFNSFDGKILHMAEGTTIKIYAPDGPLSTAVAAAIAFWEQILQAWGINVDFDQIPCAVAEGGSCIRVLTETPTGSACAESTNKNIDANGVIITSPLIRVRPNIWTQDYLNWMMTHELGHLLGLDAPNCTSDKSVMWEGLSQCGQFPAGTPATQPTDSDGIESAMGAYRNASVGRCPVQ